MHKAEQLYHLGVKAIITNVNHEILLLKRRGFDYWDLPGGRVQKGEDPVSALKREVQEETGINMLIDIDPQDIILTPFKISLDNDQTAQLLFWFYRCAVANKTSVTLSDEHSDFIWINTEEISEFLPKLSPHIVKN